MIIISLTCKQFALLLPICFIGLESMMLECSNLNAPCKASKFSKLSVKEITPSSSHSATFTASEKARDWSNIKGLDSAFIAPKQRKYNKVKIINNCLSLGCILVKNLIR